MKQKKIANREVREYVRTRSEFRGSNLFAEYVVAKYTDEGGEWQELFYGLGDNYKLRGARRCYVVYSYSRLWPLFIYDEEGGVWFENTDSRSVTTSKHKTQTHPLVPTIACSVDTMRKVITEGVNAVILRGETV
jgi:hypothetical protein